ncbi:MAG: response regulator [Betaproteobacteria bacterium]|nr:response regulator [Betaproteobacteria bacterium]
MAEAGQKTAQQPVTVLLVEDNPADVRIIREALLISRIPHRLYVVEDGEQALDFVRARGGFADAPPPDLMLLDLNIPKLHGHDVIAQLRADVPARRFPIVVLTGSKLEKDMERSFALHADEHIVKPTRLFEYVGELAFALGLVRRRTA